MLSRLVWMIIGTLIICSANLPTGSSQSPSFSSIEYQLLFTWDKQNVTFNHWTEVWLESTDQTEQLTVVTTSSQPTDISSNCYSISTSSSGTTTSVAFPDPSISFPQDQIDSLSSQIRFVRNISNCTSQETLTAGDVECDFDQTSVTDSPPLLQESVINLIGEKVTRTRDEALLSFELRALGDRNGLFHLFRASPVAPIQNNIFEFPPMDLSCLDRGSIEFPSDSEFLTRNENMVQFRTQMDWVEVKEYYESVFGAEWETAPLDSNGIQFFSLDQDRNCHITLRSESETGVYTMALDDTRTSIAAIKERLNTIDSPIFTAGATDPGSQTEYGRVTDVMRKYVEAITAEQWLQRQELSVFNATSAYLVFERSNQHIYVLMEDLGGELIQVIVQRIPVVVCGEKFNVPQS